MSLEGKTYPEKREHLIRTPTPHNNTIIRSIMIIHIPVPNLRYRTNNAFRRRIILPRAIFPHGRVHGRVTRRQRRVVHLSARMHESQEHAGHGRDGVQEVVDVRDARDVGVDVVCERLVADSGEAVDGRFEGESGGVGEMEGEVEAVEQGEGCACIALV